MERGREGGRNFDPVMVWRGGTVFPFAFCLLPYHPLCSAAYGVTF